MKKMTALIFLIFLTFLHCTNNTPLPNGYDLLEREGKVGLQPPITLQPVNIGRFWRAVPTGDKSTLLLGSGKDAHSFIILQDRNLSKVSSENTVVSAKLAMYAVDHFNDQTAYVVTAHRVERSWDEKTVVLSDVENAYRTEVLESWNFTPGDTTWHEFQFTDTNFITEWISDTKNSTPLINGLLLKFDQAPGGTVFYSSEASNYKPYIQVVSQEATGALDTTIAYLTHDASLLQATNGIAEYELEENPDVLHVGNGMGYRSMLQFDLSSLPAEATIHRARLAFVIDPDNVLIPGTSSDGAFSVGIGAADSLGEWIGLSKLDSTVIIDPNYSPGVDVASTNNATFVFDSPAASAAVSRIVQRWVSGTSKNNGFMIYPYFQGADFQEMAFKSGRIDPADMPTLEITYSLSAAHRFARQ